MLTLRRCRKRCFSVIEPQSGPVELDSDDSYGRVLSCYATIRYAAFTHPLQTNAVHGTVTRYLKQLCYFNQDANDLVNTCPRGTVVPIFDKTVIIETFCRCPSGTYGFTCEEGFLNPCTPNGAHLFPADSFIPVNYYLECKDNLPYLRKCPSDLVWNQKIPSCDWPHSDNMNNNNNNNKKPYSYGSGGSYSYSSSSVQSPPSPKNIASTVLRPSSSNLVKAPTYFPQVQTVNTPKVQEQTANFYPPVTSAASSSSSSSYYNQYSSPPQQPSSSNNDPAQPFANSCPKGYAQPIWQDNTLIATYCRCPDGSYGFTCEENFPTPCNYGPSQYHPADSRLPSYYFVQCSWNTPILKRCPNGLRWNNAVQTCTSQSG